jgi:hypothetical protein
LKSCKPCEIRPGFEKSINRVSDAFFRRDPQRWPVSAQEPFASVLAFCRLQIPPAERVAHTRTDPPC